MSSNSTVTSPELGGIPALPSLPPLDNTLGSLLVGGLVAIALWGVTCAQTWTYFTRSGYERDAPLSRLLVFLLWVFDTFDSALDGHILYHYLVTNFFNPVAIQSFVWSVVTHIVVTAVSNCIIRCLFARRVYRLSKGNTILTVWLVAVSIAELICAIIITIRAFHVHLYSELTTVKSLFYADFAANVLADGSVAISLCYYLMKSRTGFANTNRLITVFIVYTINTGALVALDATIGMVTYVLMPNNLIFLGFYLLMSKLYLNSYLASLNARQYLRQSSSDGPLSIHLSQITNSNYDSPSEASSPHLDKPISSFTRHSRSMSVKIDVERATDRFDRDGSEDIEQCSVAPVVHGEAY